MEVDEHTDEQDPSDGSEGKSKWASKKVNDALLVRWLRTSDGPLAAGVREVVARSTEELATDESAEKFLRLLSDTDNTAPRAESLKISAVVVRLRALLGGDEGEFYAQPIAEDMLHRELLKVAREAPIVMTEAGVQEEGFDGFSGEDPEQERANELSATLDGEGADTLLGRGTRTDPHVMPPHGTVPLSEFRARKGLEAAAFPTLFPFGHGGFADDRPLKKLEWSVWCQHLMNYYDGRFAKHRRFRYYLLNVQQRHQANEQAALFVRTECPKLTVGELRAMSEQSKEEIRRKCDKFSATLRNSAPFFKERKKELQAMCEQLGDPHVFATHSHADTHCEYLHRFIVKWAADDIAQAPQLDPFASGISPHEAAQRRVENLRNYPHLVALFFHLKTELYIEHVARGILHANAWWVRYEWQARGSSHAHYLLWLNQAPSLTDVFDTWVQEEARDLFGMGDGAAGCKLDIDEQQLEELAERLNERALQAAELTLARVRGDHVSSDAPRDLLHLADAAEWWGERATRWNHFWDAQERKPDRAVTQCHPCSQPPPLDELEHPPCNERTEKSSNGITRACV